MDKFTPIEYSALPDLFQKIELALAKKKQNVRVVVIGGLAIIAQGFRQRATLDLVKLKLERFYKQDPDDIYAIIQKTKMIV